MFGQDPEFITGGKILKQVKSEALGKKEILAGERVAIVLIEPGEGMDPRRHQASMISAAEKERTFKSIGVAVDRKLLPPDVSLHQFGDVLSELNADPKTRGIIVQLPVPRHLREVFVDGTLSEIKDIDGITAGNKLFPICATAEAALRIILPQMKDPSEQLVIVGGKGFVGGSIAYGLRLRGTPYSILDLGDDLRQARDAQLVIAATGQPNILTTEHLHNQHVVVDVGFTPLKSVISSPDDVAGDVDKKAYREVERITPVPGGVGPLQMAILIERMLNLVEGTQSARWSL